MYIKLTKLRQECGGCPTSYSGETSDGRYFEAYLRHGYMKITFDGRKIVSENPPGLDGVCGFDDFVRYARRNGVFIDDSGAEWSSSIEDTEKLIQELFKDTVWVKFIRDLHSKSEGKTYEKGQRYTARIDVAETLRDANYAMIDDGSYERKREAFYRERLRNELKTEKK